MSAFTIIQPPRPNLPCDSCEAECCFNAPITPDEMDRIVDYLLANVSDEEIHRMERQERKLHMCPFVDVENGYKCSIYDVRPEVCRHFGLTPKLKCSHAPEAANFYSIAETIGTSLGQLAKNDGRFLLLGGDVGWDEILHPNKRKVFRVQKEEYGIAVRTEKPKSGRKRKANSGSMER